LKLLDPEVEAVAVVPSGFNKETATGLIVLLVIFTVSNWPAVPENVKLPFCPGVVIVTG
jgi:hypothetical protein